MTFLLRIAAGIDALNTAIGRWMTWLILFCTLISALTATLRYAFDWGSNALLEAQWFMFGLVFLFARPGPCATAAMSASTCCPPGCRRKLESGSTSWTVCCSCCRSAC